MLSRFALEHLSFSQLWLDGLQGRGFAPNKIFRGYKSVADWPAADFYKARVLVDGGSQELSLSPRFMLHVCSFGAFWHFVFIERWCSFLRSAVSCECLSPVGCEGLPFEPDAFLVAWDAARD